LPANLAEQDRGMFIKLGKVPSIQKRVHISYRHAQETTPFDVAGRK